MLFGILSEFIVSVFVLLVNFGVYVVEIFRLGI